MKGLRDEYSVLEPCVNCVCGANKVQIERDQKRKLLQFLMGLHDSNSNIRGQILLMDPLPSVSQEYAFVKQDEKARQGYHGSITGSSPLVNALVPIVGNATVAAANAGYKKFNSGGVLKTPLKCTFCNFNGHTKENCYKLIGYPPNWKKKKENGASAVPVTTHLAFTSQFRPLPRTNQSTAAFAMTPSSSQGNDQLNHMQNQINQLMSMLAGTGKTTNSPDDHLAGMVTSGVNLVTSHASSYIWLIDTGATYHMCCSLPLLNDVTKLAKPISLSLPNGSVLMVDTVGSFRIHPTITLDYVFFVPTFNYNLLSVSKWISATGGTVSFYSDHCEFHVPTLQNVLANGRLISGLYHLEFHKTMLQHLFLL